MTRYSKFLNLGKILLYFNLLSSCTKVITTVPISINTSPSNVNNEQIASATIGKYSECTSDFILVKVENAETPTTINELLSQLSLPKQTLPITILEHKINSLIPNQISIYTIYDNGCTMWIVNENYDSKAHLLLLLFEKNNKQWKYIDIEGSGDVIGILKGTNNYYVLRHINPSAGITIILPNNLEEYQELYGLIWDVFMDDLAIYTPNIPHFAPTHPNKIALYNSQTKESRYLLPMQPEPILWSTFRNNIEEVYIELRNDGWCIKNNYNCNSEDFTRYYYSITINNETDSIAFIAEFIGDGPYAGPFELSDGRKLSVPNELVIYIFRNVHKENKLFAYKEFPYNTLEYIIGNDRNLSKLLEKQTLEKLFTN